MAASSIIAPNGPSNEVDRASGDVELVENDLLLEGRAGSTPRAPDDAAHPIRHGAVPLRSLWFAMHADPVATLRSAFGYPRFRPGQEELVRAVLEGRDALGVLPTGGGKSVCYQVPALMLDGTVLVVTPLVSLMQDQIRRARAIGLGAECLSGTQTASERQRVIERVRAGRVSLLLVSPERLEIAGFRSLLDAVRVSLVAVDEAHCISEWGHDFRPAYRRIGRLLTLEAPVLALTASATPAVRADIVESLGLVDPLRVVRSFDRPNLRWAVERRGPGDDRIGAVRRALRGGEGAGIVYAPTRRAAEILRDGLAARGHSCDVYHAGLTGAERSSVQERFLNRDVRVVVATNAFGMGIDKADVRAVIHLQLPGTLESYYQEAGRAGRDGEPSICVAFHNRSDRRLANRFIARTHPRRSALVRLWRALRGASLMGAVADIDHPKVVRALSEPARTWAEGDPVGALGALERIGAISRVESVTGRTERVLVRSEPDWTAAAGLRRRAMDKVADVERYARERRCRRNALLRYFGEKRADRCGQCDRCGWRMADSRERRP